MLETGYKQTLTYINKLPNTLVSKVYSIPTNICKSYYYPDKPKCTDINELMKRSPRYCFSFISRGSEKRTFIKNCCYFDNLDEAKTAVNDIQAAYLIGRRLAK